MAEADKPKNRKERRASAASKAKMRADAVVQKKLAHMHRTAGKLIKHVRSETMKKLDASVENFFAPKTT